MSLYSLCAAQFGTSVKQELGAKFSKCGPYLIYIRIVASTEPFYFCGVTISKVAAASGSIHFNIRASDLNVWGV